MRINKSAVLMPLSALVLAGIGVVCLTAAGDVLTAHGPPPLFYVKRQLMYLLVGLAAGVAAATIDYHWWRHNKVVTWLLAIAVISLILAPVCGPNIHGCRRWLSVGPLRFQPSEFAKFAVVVGLAYWSAAAFDKKQMLRELWFLPLPLLGLIVYLVVIEPDTTTAMLIGITGWTILLVAIERRKELAVVALASVVLASVCTLQDPVAGHRLMAWWNPDAHPYPSSPILAVREAFERGGICGTGFGCQPFRHMHPLPEARTDYVFAVVGEHLGMVGAVGVVLLFILMAIIGTLISLRAPDRFGMLLAMGLVLSITLQAALNICGVTGLLPVRGAPLPFLSYGGSGLVVVLMEIGILVNVARQSTRIVPL